MTKKIVGFLSFLLGVGAGGAGVYFGLKKKMQADFDSKLNEISSFYVNKYIKKESESVSEEAKNDEKNDNLGVDKEQNIFKRGEINPSMKVVSSLDGNDFVTEKHKESYSNLFVGTDALSGNGKDPRAPIADILEEKGPVFPLRITRGMFENDKDFRKIYLTYYEESGVFGTIDDVESEYTEDYFGLDNLSKFGSCADSEYDDDAFTLHFRSDRDKVDFELYYEPTLSWEEVLLNTGGEK